MWFHPREVDTKHPRLVKGRSTSRIVQKGLHPTSPRLRTRLNECALKLPPLFLLYQPYRVLQNEKPLFLCGIENAKRRGFAYLSVSRSQIPR